MNKLQFEQMYFKILSMKRRPFCLEANDLMFEAINSLATLSDHKYVRCHWPKGQ